MDYIIDAFLGAFWLILSLDREIFSIALLSLRVAGTATVFATLIGVPLAYVIATRDFPGKRTVLTIFNTLMAVPTVLVGLFCYAFFSRRGPLGFLDLLFTPTGMVIGDLILALPLIVALTIAAVNAVDPRGQAHRAGPRCHLAPDLLDGPPGCSLCPHGGGHQRLRACRG